MSLSLQQLQSGTIGIVGLGRSGVAAVQFLAQRGYKVLAWDQNPEKGIELTHLAKVVVDHSPNPALALKKCDVILLSPGIPRSHNCLQQAIMSGVAVINDVEWLYKHSQQEKNPASFIGITGTNGKSTVTTLVGLMLQNAKFNTQTGGNLGQAALSLWSDKVEKFVLELSSFQLESLNDFHPQTAALLNISPDHLDRYNGLEDYLSTKLQIFNNQTNTDHAVLNGDDPVVLAAYEKIAKNSDALVTIFSTKKQIKGGLYIKDGQLIDHTSKEAQPLISCDELKITGVHNHANALAAAAIALAAGASRKAVIETLKTFPGLPHRMEWIKTVDGVEYYNDSKGTNVGAVLQSLASFPKKELVLIAGGRDKNSNFTPLIAPLKKHVPNLILIGEAADNMAQLLKGYSNIEHASSMELAVLKAHQLAKPGQIVLLSPACTSFDMFKNFEDRGDIFRKVVNEL
ncbi:MAG: UDP-N-acetylmuramoyl-L-alanine--D-glutamate ligase [Magnetococcales bacterium]|nr:UDP-N-acetylmuramoyl-L-alanine--D-glutamate ligase [Magnetococcales bacterium]